MLPKCPYSAYSEDIGEEIPIKQGFLNVVDQQASGFSLNRISKKKSSLRYCLLFKASRHGIERLEIGESKDDKNPKIITLENCVKITQEPSPANMILIVKKTQSLTLNTLNDDDLKEWVNALQTVAFRDKNGSHSSTHAAIEEDNDLYCSSYGDGLFIVKLIPSETSVRCNIEPKTYMLHLTAADLQLKSAEDINVVVAKWPYRFIRKYGYRDRKFTFEAGRKCSTGEGVFTLDHTNPQEIFRCMSATIKSTKKRIRGESPTGIDCGENQLSVAASMEAGSRSPLPPSPSNQHMSSDFEINSLECSINTNSSTSSICIGANIAALPMKNIPNKPPRKLPALVPHLPLLNTTLPLNNNSIVITPQPENKTTNHVKKFQNYEPVSITSKLPGPSGVILKPKTPDANSECPPDLPVRNESSTTKTVNLPATEQDYERIETITHAWKTMGIGDIKHTERVLDSDDSTAADFNWQRSKITQKQLLPLSKAPRIIDIDIGEGGNTNNNNGSGNSLCNSENAYDHLDFLTPNNKTSSSYKTIVTLSQPPVTMNRSRYSPVTNDYELIASPDTQACRKADDHLGYGMLRKATTGVSPLVETAKAITNTTPPSPHSRANNNALSPTSEVSLLATTSPSSPTALPDHKNYNGLDYTIVSKPKRV